MQISLNSVEMLTINCGLISKASRPTLGDIHVMFRDDNYAYTHLYLTAREASNLAIALAESIVELEEEARREAD